MMDIIRSQCDFRWILIGFIFALAAQIFRALRWQIQLRALGIEAPVWVLALSIFGTYAVNLVLPRLGEVWRTGYIANRQKASFTTVFGSMVADRLCDTICVALISLLAFALASSAILSYFHETGAALDAIAALIESPWLWIAAVAGIALFVFIMRMKTDNKIVVGFQRIVKSLWDGFAVLATMQGKGRWLLYTAGVWVCYFTQLYVQFYAFPFTTDVVTAYGLPAVLVTFTLGSLAMAVPSNGGIGPWQWAVMFALGIYGLPESQSGAFANLALGTTTLFTIALGLITFAVIALNKKNNKSANG